MLWPDVLWSDVAWPGLACLQLLLDRTLTPHQRLQLNQYWQEHQQNVLAARQQCKDAMLQVGG